MNEAGRLVAWYRANRRDLPWRQTNDPYAIWVSEIMLQQTQVATVIPYYERWLRAFPTVESLASADEDKLLELWQGLGYYRRARNLQAGARQVAAVGVPSDREGWRKVPGVGDYTSAAIASIAFGERCAVVDGNVERVYARVAADRAVGAELKRHSARWAQALIDSTHEPAGDVNQALMELGATVCKPRDPNCAVCPLQDCRARDLHAQDVFPVPTAKPKTVKLTRYLLGYTDGRTVALRRIPEGEWVSGMWEIPWTPEAPDDPYEFKGRHIHSVTHHRITLHVLRMMEMPAEGTLFPLEALPALPSPMRKAIEILIA